MLYESIIRLNGIFSSKWKIEILQELYVIYYHVSEIGGYNDQSRKK